MHCRNALQVIETGSYNFCRMSVFWSSAPNHQEDHCSSTHATHRHGCKLLTEPHGQQQQPEAAHSKLVEVSKSGQRVHYPAISVPVAHTNSQAKRGAIIAIAGHDPAVLDIWDLQVMYKEAAMSVRCLDVLFTHIAAAADCRLAALLCLCCAAILCGCWWNAQFVALAVLQFRGKAYTKQKDVISCSMCSSQAGSLVQQLLQPEGAKHGMCMAVQLYKASQEHSLHALVGYEDGTAAVWRVADATILASKRFHDEPIMAVAVAADGSSECLPIAVLWLANNLHG